MFLFQILIVYLTVAESNYDNNEDTSIYSSLNLAQLFLTTPIKEGVLAYLLSLTK